MSKIDCLATLAFGLPASCLMASEVVFILFQFFCRRRDDRCRDASCEDVSVVLYGVPRLIIAASYSECCVNIGIIRVAKLSTSFCEHGVAWHPKVLRVIRNPLSTSDDRCPDARCRSATVVSYGVPRLAIRFFRNPASSGRQASRQTEIFKILHI
jgi:hypothetical protein